MADPDRYVHALINEIHHPVEKQEAHLHGRIGMEEGIHERTDVQVSEKQRCCYGEHAARRGTFAGGKQLCLIKVGQNAATCGDVSLACLGQPHNTRRAV